MLRRRKRTAMDVDSSQVCGKCGIICDWSKSDSNTRFSTAKLCRACECFESGQAVTKTPCGQNYCKSCGFLTDALFAVTSAQSARRAEFSFCFGCSLRQAAFLEPEDFNKAEKCQCDFCTNHSDVSPPERKIPKVSFSQNRGGTPAVQSKTPIRATRPSTQDGPSKRNTSAEKGSGRQQQQQSPVSDMEIVIGDSDDDNDTPPGGRFENLVEDELRKKWEREQLNLKIKMKISDSNVVRDIVRGVERNNYRRRYFIGGVDISFIKGNNVDACAALMVISFPDLELVYKRMEMIKLTAPYIPGFLAFREVDSIVKLYSTLIENAPQYKPDIIFVDGNGQLHPRGFGLACHLGVTLDVPCVGVAKTLIHVDGIEDDEAHKAKKQNLSKAGDSFKLTTTNGECLGAALRSTDSSSNPIYVSVGHKISLSSALKIVHKCCKYRIAEPTRLADVLSRQYLTEGHTEPFEVIYGKKK